MLKMYLRNLEDAGKVNGVKRPKDQQLVQMAGTHQEAIKNTTKGISLHSTDRVNESTKGDVFHCSAFHYNLATSSN